jgi:6-phosphogluconolactonase
LGSVKKFYFSSEEALFNNTADLVCNIISDTVSNNGKCLLALSGGNTPRGLYKVLTEKKELKWDKVHIFWSDERYVPPDNEQSNYRSANENIISKINIPVDNIHRVETELPVNDAAEKYEQEIIKTWNNGSSTGSSVNDSTVPVFDLILLGIGDDGHTASLFPGTPALNEDKKLVSSNYIPALKAERITFTYKLINNASVIIFLVSGSSKKEILQKIFKDKEKTFPASGVDPVNGKVYWMICTEN